MSANNSTSLNPAKLTLAAWFFMDDFNISQTVISKPRTAAPWTSPFTTWLIRLNSSTAIEPGLSGSSYNSGTFTLSSPLRIKEWYHIVMTYDGTTRVVYLNGVQVSTSAGPGALTYAAQPVLIGADHGASPVGDQFKGKIDDVRVYNRVLNAGEVLRLYKLGQ